MRERHGKENVSASLRKLFLKKEAKCYQQDAGIREEIFRIKGADKRRDNIFTNTLQQIT